VTLLEDCHWPSVQFKLSVCVWVVPTLQSLSSFVVIGVFISSSCLSLGPLYFYDGKFQFTLLRFVALPGKERFVECLTFVCEHKLFLAALKLYLPTSDEYKVDLLTLVAGDLVYTVSQNPDRFFGVTLPKLDGDA